MNTAVAYKFDHITALPPATGLCMIACIGYAAQRIEKIIERGNQQ